MRTQIPAAFGMIIALWGHMSLLLGATYPDWGEVSVRNDTGAPVSNLTLKVDGATFSTNCVRPSETAQWSHAIVANATNLVIEWMETDGSRKSHHQSISPRTTHQLCVKLTPDRTWVWSVGQLEPHVFTLQLVDHATLAPINQSHLQFVSQRAVYDTNPDSSRSSEREDEYSLSFDTDPKGTFILTSQQIHELTAARRVYAHTRLAGYPSCTLSYDKGLGPTLTVFGASGILWQKIYLRVDALNVVILEKKTEQDESTVPSKAAPSAPSDVR